METNWKTILRPWPHRRQRAGRRTPGRRCRRRHRRQLGVPTPPRTGSGHHHRRPTDCRPGRCPARTRTEIPERRARARVSLQRAWNSGTATAPARPASRGGTLRLLFWLSLVLLVGTLGSENRVLFRGYPKDIRTSSSAASSDSPTAWPMVLAFWYRSSNGSERKTELLAQSPPVK